jgi:hypothetical protein
MKATTKAKAAPKSAPKANKTFSAEERAAMQDAAREAKARSKGKVDGEAEIRAKIAELKGDDKAMAERVHAIVRKAAPGLEPRTWYGMPAYADQTGKAVVFFQPAGKFKARYAHPGLQRQRPARRRRHVAHGLCPHQAHRSRRGENRSPGQEGGGLTGLTGSFTTRFPQRREHFGSVRLVRNPPAGVAAAVKSR